MRFKNHKLVDIPFQKARWTGGEIPPELVVLHDTASRLTKGNARDYLADNDVKVSVHFVIELDGTITQQVPISRRANHAGRSSYHGRKNVNGFSVGIELVNPGRMSASQRHGKARTWYGEELDIALWDIHEVTTAEHGHGFWMAYPEAQMTALLELLEALFARRGNKLTDIRPHWYVSPGRKVDTNPLFPLAEVRSHIFGREDPLQSVEDAVAMDETEGGTVQIDVNDDTLNMRAWPSFNPNIIAKIPAGTVVPVLAHGDFDGREWLKVFYAGQEGWVVANYANDFTY